MPAKNRIKQYKKGGYYHIYNRGVEKRKIFQDQQDYSTFLSYLKTYLSPKDEASLRTSLEDPEISWKEKEKILKLLRLNNFADTINLLCFCLVPNHFHFLLKQLDERSLPKFLASLSTRYSMYFNRKYERVGPLFQDIYKAVLVETDAQLLHLSRYIHLHVLDSTPQGPALRKEQPSSYPNYLGSVSQEWVKPDEILAFFKTAQRTSLTDFFSYQSFVETYKEPVPRIVSNLALDLD